MTDTKLAEQIKKSNSTFTNKIYQILSKNPGNVFFSPFCLHSVLSMAYQGAQNKTAKVIQDVLQIPDAQSTAEGYRAVLEELENIEEVQLSVANKIYARKGVEFLEKFEKSVTMNFHSETESVDFGNATETANKINGWVLEKTEVISNMLDESAIKQDTSLFLLNAIYFKSNWELQFEEESTKTKKFYLDKKSSIDVEMMHGKQSGFYKNDKELKAEVISISYHGDNVRLIFILPNAKDGIEELEAKLATRDLLAVSENVECTDLDISIPKFKFETTIGFNDVAKKIGLGEIFDREKADFKKMVKLTSGENLYVGEILQKACIDVNEQGSEAAAAAFMSMGMLRCAHPVKPKFLRVVVDHPAIFMIVEGVEMSRNILFCGRLSRPKY